MVPVRDYTIGRLIPRYVIVAVVALLTAACAIEVGKGPALTQLDRLEADLTGGVSKKSDVLFLLGEPDGTGGALFPTATAPNDVWYYEASAVSLSNVNQTILLIYFEDDVFAGYQWFSNAANLEVQ
jgi:hypothetical protein